MCITAQHQLIYENVNNFPLMKLNNINIDFHCTNYRGMKGKLQKFHHGLS